MQNNAHAIQANDPEGYIGTGSGVRQTPAPAPVPALARGFSAEQEEEEEVDDGLDDDIDDDGLGGPCTAEQAGNRSREAGGEAAVAPDLQREDDMGLAGCLGGRAAGIGSLSVGRTVGASSRRTGHVL